MSKHSTPNPIVNPQETTINENLVVTLLGITMVLVIMNTMMFNLALVDVSHAFHISASSTSWIVAGYSIVFAISSITHSRLADFLPIRRLFIIALLAVSLGAIGGFFSVNYVSLLVVRIVQAFGAGAIPALSLLFITRYVPLERRGRATATVMSAVSLGLGLGPVVGGFITNYFGWKYLFVVTAIMLVLIPLYLRKIPSEKPAKGTFDLLGALLVAMGTTGILLFITNGSWISLIVGVIGLILFTIQINRVKNPFVQPVLFKNRSYLLLIVVGIISYLCSFATLFLMPQILVHRFGLTASISGLIIFPGSLLAMIMSRKVGNIIDQYGNKSIIRYVPLLVLASVVLFALFNSTSYIAILFIYMLLSVSFTFLQSSIPNEISRILPDSEIGSGLGMFQLLQFFSGAFGVAITSSALDLQHNLSLSAAYSNIYWGMAIIVVISIISAYFYHRFIARSIQTS